MSKARILVVDDNDDIRTLTAKILELIGHEVVEADSGPAALMCLPEFQPEVVLLDVAMPGMDGYEVARRIRLDGAHKHVFIVAVTGYGREEDVNRSRESGCDHHLLKPLEIQQLEAINSAWESRKSL